MQIPSHKDYQEFAWEVHASFEVPAAWNWEKKMKNHYTPPPAHFSVMKHYFLLSMKEEFATQDIHLAQSQNTIAYMRVLQYWAELVQSPVPSQPCSLVESMWELKQVMEPLISFGEEEVFVTIAPSNWMEVAPPQSLETTLQPPLETQKSPWLSTQAHLRGPITMTQSEGQHTVTVKQTPATKEALGTTSCQLLTDSQLPCQPPEFTKIVQILTKEEPMQSSPTPVIISVPAPRTAEPCEVMGMAVTVTRVSRCQITGEMMIQVYWEGIVDLGLNPAWSGIIKHTGKCLFLFISCGCIQGSLWYLKLVFLSCLCTSQVAQHPVFIKPGTIEARTITIQRWTTLWGQDATSVCPPKLKSSNVPMIYIQKKFCQSQMYLLKGSHICSICFLYVNNLLDIVDTYFNLFTNVHLCTDHMHSYLSANTSSPLWRAVMLFPFFSHLCQ